MRTARARRRSSFSRARDPLDVRSTDWARQVALQFRNCWSDKGAERPLTPQNPRRPAKNGQQTHIHWSFTDKTRDAEPRPSDDRRKASRHHHHLPRRHGFKPEPGRSTGGYVRQEPAGQKRAAARCHGRNRIIGDTHRQPVPFSERPVDTAHNKGQGSRRYDSNDGRCPATKLRASPIQDRFEVLDERSARYGTWPRGPAYPVIRDLARQTCEQIAAAQRHLDRLVERHADPAWIFTSSATFPDQQTEDVAAGMDDILVQFIARDGTDLRSRRPKRNHGNPVVPPPRIHDHGRPTGPMIGRPIPTAAASGPSTRWTGVPRRP